MTAPPPPESALSGRRIPSSLRMQTTLAVFMLLLLFSLSGTVVVLVTRIFDRLTPAIALDLAWKAEHGVRELSNSLELPCVLKDPSLAVNAVTTYLRNADVLGVVVVEPDGTPLLVRGSAPRALSDLFSGAPGAVVKERDSYWSWWPVQIEEVRVGKVAVIVSTRRLKEGERLRADIRLAVLLAAAAAVCVALFFVRSWLAPMMRLTNSTLSDLREINATLDARVNRRTGELSAANGQLEQGLTELRTTQGKLMELSRKTGMADVATAVLHNVGNVLNNVNVSASLVIDAMHESKTMALPKLAALLAEHRNDLPGFFGGERGQRFLPYLEQLAAAVSAEQAGVVKELDTLRKNIDHIKTIVSMQQSHAKSGGVLEQVDLNEMVDEALRLSTLPSDRHGLQLVREFCPKVQVVADRQKISQILLNLLGNARHAVRARENGPQRVVVSTIAANGKILIEVADNGCGIPPENLNRIFNHGFTTKKDGHGFGLHSSACAAKEMGGALSCVSRGIDKGAVFRLELPLSPPRNA